MARPIVHWLSRPAVDCVSPPGILGHRCIGEYRLLIRTDGRATARRTLGGEVSDDALVHQPARQRCETDPERGHHLLAGHAPLHSGEHTLAKINQIGAHTKKYARGSTFMPTAVRRSARPSCI